MPATWFFLFNAVLFLAVGIGYFASPRFVEWYLRNDRRGRMWVERLGYPRALIAARYIFSLILIGGGAFLIYISLDLK